MPDSRRAVGSKRQSIQSVPNGWKLYATIRTGDMISNSAGTAEFTVANGDAGQYAWPNIKETVGTTDWKSFVVDCAPGGGPNNISVTLDDNTVGGGSVTYGNISDVVIVVTASPIDGVTRWRIDADQLAVTFSEADRTGHEGVIDGPGGDSMAVGDGVPLLGGNGDDAGNLEVFASDLRSFSYDGDPDTNPAVSVHVQGRVKLTNNNGQLLTANSLTLKVYIYADD